MELQKYNSIVSTFRQYEEAKSPYWYTIEWEAIDQQGWKNWTGAKRVTGIETFINAVDSLQQLPNCANIRVVAYSGQTGKKELFSEIIEINGKKTNIYSYFLSSQETRKNSVSSNHSEQQKGFGATDLLGAILGQPGLSGTDAIHGLLSIRDERIVNQFERKELEQKLLEAQLREKNLEEKIKNLEKKNATIENENEELSDTLDELERKIAELEKLKPQNSLLGVSLTGIASTVAENIIKKIVLSNPDAVANILGTDKKMLHGLFEQQVEQNNNQHNDNSEIEIEEVELSTERKQELEVIDKITEYLKTLDRKQLGYVQNIVYLWLQDVDTIQLMYEWASGKGNKSSNSKNESSDE